MKPVNGHGERAQGSLEYLILIGGAVAVAAIVVVLLLGVSSSGGTSAKTSVDTYMETQAASGADVGLLKNTSFERGASDWAVSGAGSKEIISSGCINGTKCVHVLPAASQDWTGYSQTVTVGASGPLVIGKTYTVSVYKKGLCSVVWNCRNNTTIISTPAGCTGGLESGSWSSPSAWTRVSKTFTTIPGINNVIFYVSSGAGVNLGEGYCEMVLVRDA